MDRSRHLAPTCAATPLLATWTSETNSCQRGWCWMKTPASFTLHFILVACGRCGYQLVDTFLIGLATWERYEIDQARL